MSELRYDPLLDEYALVAPERLHRPECVLWDEKEERKPEEKLRCPFCPGNEKLTPPQIFAIESGDPDGSAWRTRVVPNLYKAVRIEAPWESRREGPYETREGFGAHEIIVDTPRHLKRMDLWDRREYVDWLKTMRARVADLRNDIRLEHISLFKNHGPRAGATQSHPHTQLIALPAVPSPQLERFERALRYRRSHGRSYFESVLEFEIAEGKRVVAQSEEFVAYCPYASAYAFETAVVAVKEGVVSVADLDDEQIEDLAVVLKKCVDALYRRLGDFSFNILFETPPLRKNERTDAFFDEIPAIWRLWIRIVPRLFYAGGFELAGGAAVNPVAPEEAAELLAKGDER